MKVYLSGPIAGVSQDLAAGWRNKARHILEGMGHSVLDPMRNPYDGENYIRIVELDKKDIHRCDAVICNPWARTPGTAAEVTYAYDCLNRPVLTIVRRIQGEKCFVSPWVLAHSHALYPDLESAIAGLDLIVYGAGAC